MRLPGDNSNEVIGEDRKASLSEVKRSLLEQRMRGVAKETEPAIQARTPGMSIPLSAEQRRIWLHALEQPDLPVYNESVTLLKYGSLNHLILEAAFHKFLLRHEAWRTSFTSQGEQIVHDNAPLSLPLIDLTHLALTEREEQALIIANNDARAPLAIDGFPLFRATLVRMAPDEHRIFLTFHHIIFDGVSNERIFIPELVAIYTALENGQPVTLPSLAIQYGDYSIWREKHVESPAVRRHLAWWRDNLSGQLPTLRLPEDHPRSASTDHHGAMERIRIPAPLARSLRQLSRDHGATLYMTLLAAFNVLLFRYTGQNDFIVGSATDARRRPELESVIGYFLDTFALRTSPNAECSFSEYLSLVRDSVLAALAVADAPFDRIVKELRPEREPGRHPVFQVFFTMRPVLPPPIGEWSLVPSDATTGTTKFDLHLEVGYLQSDIDARFFFRTDIWEVATIHRFASNWLVLLQSICRNPQSTLSDLTILTTQESGQLLGPRGWNDTSHSLPRATLNHLFEDQVSRAPHHIAATFAGESWTYAQLNSRVEVHAARLRAAGVVKRSIVAIFLDRSLDMLAALLAASKVRAAYLPLDLQTSPARLALLLADAQPAVIVTQQSLLHQIGSASCPVVLVDNDRQPLTEVDPTAQAAATSPVECEPEDTAYLIYTSGTTGEPKAVEISQQSLVNLLISMQTAPGFTPEDVLLAVTPISFDIAALELFLPLISGGTVVIASRQEAKDPYLLAQAIRNSCCTVMQTTPARWRALLLSGWKNVLQDPAQAKSATSTVRRILCGGEPLTRELANLLLATGAELWNMYGPTETTIWSLIHRVLPDLPGEASQIPVGLPIANTTAFILDAQRQPLPIGVPGELFLGGTGLAKGYRNQPERTADRFSVVESVGGLRVYRTGDHAVRRPDGSIEILGRTDNQVKIRGHRVELEAVEAAALRHPRVVAAAARAWPEPSGNLRLALYIVPAHQAPALSLPEMRSFLRSTLPDPMLPSDLIPLETIPLTPHGKIDRARLPEPVSQQAALVDRRPGSSAELRLAAIWSELLGRGPVGLDDNFFDLGGHSFLVAALQQRIAGEFKLQIPVAELLHWPTIREQAAVMQPGGKPALPPGVIALQPAGPRDTIFWMHSINRNLAEALGDDQPFLALVLTPEDVASLGNSPRLEDIADRHLRKILATQPEGPYTLGGFCAHGILAYEIASQLRTAGHEVALVILLDSYNPSWIRPRNSLSLKFNYLRYGISRLARIGRQSRLVHLRTRWHLLRKYVARTMSGRTALRSAYEMVEAAASRYRPETYDGKVLLVLASDRPPDVEPLPGWQAVVPSRLSWQYVDGHHSELLRAPSVGGVAAAIRLHLDSHSSGTSHSYRTEATPPTIADRWDERDDALAFSER